MPVEERNDAASSSARLNRQNAIIESQIEELEKSDIVTSLTHLGEQFSGVSKKPGEFSILKEDKNYMIFGKMNVEQAPYIEHSVKVNSDLAFEVYHEKMQFLLSHS